MRIYLVNIPEPVQYVIYAMTVAFDLRSKSSTCDLPDIYALAQGPQWSEGVKKERGTRRATDSIAVTQV